MLSEKLQAAFNHQINEELFSAYMYLAAAAWCDNNDFPGFASWMKVQAQEEVVHAMKFYTFINDRNGRVELAPLAGPKTDWHAPLEVFSDARHHEEHISQCIHSLVGLAREEKDYAAENFLQWFVSEQVEEEASATLAVGKLKLAGDNSSALLMLDNEFGARTFTAPAAGSEA
jgi:ferritin